MTRSLRTQGPRASRCSLPLSLYLKTRGRWSSREAGEGWGQGVRHAYPAHPRWPSSHRGLAQDHSSVKSLSMSM